VHRSYVLLACRKFWFSNIWDTNASAEAVDNHRKGAYGEDTDLHDLRHDADVPTLHRGVLREGAIGPVMVCILGVSLAQSEWMGLSLTQLRSLLGCEVGEGAVDALVFSADGQKMLAASGAPRRVGRWSPRTMSSRSSSISSSVIAISL
jgi:hypothetical protein